MPVLDKLLMKLGRSRSKDEDVQQKESSKIKRPSRKFSEYADMELPKASEEFLEASLATWKKTDHSWQGVDFSTNSYCQDRHPYTKDFIREYADLAGPPKQPVRVARAAEPLEQNDKHASEDQQVSAGAVGAGVGEAADAARSSLEKHSRQESKVRQPNNSQPAARPNSSAVTGQSAVDQQQQ